MTKTEVTPVYQSYRCQVTKKTRVRPVWVARRFKITAKARKQAKAQAAFQG